MSLSLFVVCLHPYICAFSHSFLCGIEVAVTKAPAPRMCQKDLLKRTMCLGKSLCRFKLELFEIRRHGLILVCFARLALAPSPIVLADAPPSALLAQAPLPSVLADARPSALLALAPYPSVLADARPSALLAPVSSPIVLALPRLPPSCSLAPPAAPSLVAIWRRPLTAALSSLLTRSALAA